MEKLSLASTIEVFTISEDKVEEALADDELETTFGSEALKGLLSVIHLLQ